MSFSALAIWTCHSAKWSSYKFKFRFGLVGLATAPTFTYGAHFEMMITATAGYMIIMLLFVIIYIADDSDRLFEILFLIGGIIVNLGGGVWLLIDAITYEGNWVPLVLGGLMIGSGVVMIIDLIRAFKSN